MLAGVLAYVWIRAEVRRVQHYQRFDYRPHGQVSATNSLPGTNEAIFPSPTTTLTQAFTNVFIAGYESALSGGDVAAGRKIFFNKPEASCGKCHRVGSEGGDNGPVLDGISSRATPEYMLESLIAPNAIITRGYETVILRLKNGTGTYGVLREETDTKLVLHTPEDGPITVNKSDIAERLAGVSPMPATLGELLSKADIRDLMAYLMTLTNRPATK